MAFPAFVRDRFLQPGANAGLSIVWDMMVLTTLFRGGRPPDRAAGEFRGITGYINLCFTGEGGGAWHIHFRDGDFIIRRSAHEQPRATIRMAVDEFFRLLTGHTSMLVSEMTGRTKIEGEGLSGGMMAGIFRQLRFARTVPGFQGWFARRWLAMALRASSTQLAFKELDDSS